MKLLHYKLLCVIVISLVLTSKGDKTFPYYKTCVDTCVIQCENSGNSMVQLRGPPGKMGPRGAIGPIGKPGECSCKKEMAEMKERLNLIAVEACGVGVKFEGSLPDNAITSSSDFDDSVMRRAATGRLNKPQSSGDSYGGWLMGKPVRFGGWLQVDLSSPLVIKGVVTQGRDDAWNYRWVKTYKVSYGLETSSMTFVEENGEEKIFQGNVDTAGYAIQMFKNPVKARFIRIYPVSWQTYPYLRFELLKC